MSEVELITLTAAILSQVSNERWEKCIPQAIELHDGVLAALAARRETVEDALEAQRLINAEVQR